MIYLDPQATTPCDPRVLEKMIPYFYEKFGNPHSRNHAFGWEAENAIDHARDQIAQLIGCDPSEIIFLSGATEANNLALKGMADFIGHKKNHMITSSIEHKCILDTLRHLEQKKIRVTYLPVDQEGFINLDSLKEAITPETALVSIIFANNEIGTIQHIKEITDICHEKGTLFHTDGAQALGKIPIDVERLGIDLMSMSGHKIYGPKGIGALYVRKKGRRVRLFPQMHGGGQERGLRSGTLPTPLCVGFGEACSIARQDMANDQKRITDLTNQLKNALFSELTHIFMNGSIDHRLPGNLNISFSCVEGESLMMAVKDLAISSGSACTSSSLEPSYVLRAIGVDEELAHTSLRFGIGRFTTEEEVKIAAKSIIQGVNKLRSMSPLWDMLQDGIDLKSVIWTE